MSFIVVCRCRHIVCKHTSHNLLLLCDITLLQKNSSVPRNDTPDTRPNVVLSLKRLDTHFPIDDGKRVVCLAGCGISTLASSIQSWFPDRESHSILGSTFLNPTTAAVSWFL